MGKITKERIDDIKKAIKEAIENNIKATDVARKLNITRQRLYQIIKQFNLPYFRKNKKYIKKYICIVCGKKYERDKKSKSKWCSKECREKYLYQTFICEVCRKEFKRRKKEVQFRQKKQGLNIRFCSKKCHGRWLGTYYGWGGYAR